MQLFIFVVFAIATVSAGWIPLQHHHHVPVIHNGVPVETPEVQHAKAEHFALIEKATSHPDFHHEEFAYEEPVEHHFNDHHEDGYSTSLFSHSQHDHFNHNNAVHHSLPHHHTSPAYETSHHHPGVDHHGQPLDTPEVEAAKAHHFAAYQEALARLGPQKHDNEHFDHHFRRRREIYGEWEHEHIPLIGHDDFHHYGHVNVHASTDHHAHEYSVHQTHAPVYGHHHHSHEIPLIDHDGKPLDTAEVEQAKALHFAAHDEAKHQALYGHHQTGPSDTPEVQHAKVLHFAAHAHAKAHHH